MNCCHVVLTTTQQRDYYSSVAQQHNNETVAQEPTVGTTLMVPESLWKRLRIESTERRVSQQKLWIQALEEFLDRK